MIRRIERPPIGSAAVLRSRCPTMFPRPPRHRPPVRIGADDARRRRAETVSSARPAAPGRARSVPARRRHPGIPAPGLFASIRRRQPGDRSCAWRPARSSIRPSAPAVAGGCPRAASNRAPPSACKPRSPTAESRWALSAAAGGSARGAIGPADSARASRGARTGCAATASSRRVPTWRSGSWARGCCSTCAARWGRTTGPCRSIAAVRGALSVTGRPCGGTGRATIGLATTDRAAVIGPAASRVAVIGPAASRAAVVGSTTRGAVRIAAAGTVMRWTTGRGAAAIRGSGCGRNGARRCATTCCATVAIFAKVSAPPPNAAATAVASIRFTATIPLHTPRRVHCRPRARDGRATGSTTRPGRSASATIRSISPADIAGTVAPASNRSRSGGIGAPGAVMPCSPGPPRTRRRFRPRRATRSAHAPAAIRTP